jgi:hypothetical protein
MNERSSVIAGHNWSRDGRRYRVTTSTPPPITAARRFPL